ncbi:hypothetical protein [Streptomyces sp. wa1063]|uniref:hypothetical protein n=1 Tax=Streptomyces sp. wa1063 TaxID=1828212 RepID=UPI000BF0AE48|nr:hypothetical protein [Streptomyces sp. wa1063]
MADDVNITVRVRDATMSGIQSVNRGLQRLENGTKDMDKSFGSLVGTAVSLAPALLPIAASTAPLVAGMGAATIGVAAFGAAIIPQIQAMSEAAEAEKKYTDAVEKHGAASAEAAKAEEAYLDSIADMPPATRQAAAALSVLKEEYEDWSNSLSDDTMPVVTKSFAALGALFPKMTPLVKGASTELDRFVTIAAAGIQSQSFERFMDSFADFSTVSLAKANSGLVQFTRTLDTGEVGGGVSEFMQYARESGPLVGETLMNLVEALSNLLVASAETGVGMLTLINAFAGLVASVPPEVLTRLLQLALAFKAVKMAAAGMAAAGAAMAVVRTQVTAAGVAAVGAGTRMGMLTAAFAALSRGAKLAVAATGVGLLVITLMELSDIGKSTPPNIDKMTSSLGQFAQSGKAAGEMTRVFGKDLDGLMSSLSVLAGAGVSADEFFRRFDENPIDLKEATQEIEAIDKSLASLVSGGKADLAAAGLDRIKTMMTEAGYSTAGLKTALTEYDEALANAAFEQQLIADSMGVFGEQSLQVQTKLDAQKRSADGLAQSINALSNQYIQARGGIRGMEAAIDAADEAMQKNGKTLDIGTEKGRANQEALDNLASATMKAAEAARTNGSSWETVHGIYDRGRAKLIESAQAMGMTETQARKLAAQILRTPDKTARLKGNMEDLQQKLNAAKAKLKSVPDSRQAKIRGNIYQLEQAIAEARRKLDAINGKTSHTYVVTHMQARQEGAHGTQLGYAHGGVIGAASGGPRSRMTLVGEQGPELVDLAPGSRVRSNPDTKRMLTGGHAGGGGQPIVVQLALDGRALAEVLIDPLRGQIQTLSGGNVQAALGRG